MESLSKLTVVILTYKTNRQILLDCLNSIDKKVKVKLDGYAKTPLKEAVIEEIFYIQDLLAEVKRNVS